jgi:Mg2+ and Co2+ transporter CorA
MRALTVVSAVLLPAVVLAGIMGMNFDLPFFDDPKNFWLVVAAMPAFAVLILAVARFRGWI